MYSEKEMQELIEENLSLKEKLKLAKPNFVAKAQSGFKISKKIFPIFLGRRLNNSLLQLSEELPNKVKKETVAELIGNIVWRITRIGIFAIIIALIPIFLLIQQNSLLKNQNYLVEIQNKRIQEQTFLQEAERRSSLVFLMNNVLEKIDDELKDKNNTNRDLSQQLIGRIISLSQSFKPYYYLENGELITHQLSPERGQLLITLVNSNLGKKTYRKLFLKADFSFADLTNTDLSDSDLISINLQHANFQFSTIKNVNLNGAKLGFANFEYSNLEGANLNNTLINKANFNNSNLIGAQISVVDIFESATFENALIHNTVINHLNHQFKVWLDKGYVDSTYTIQEYKKIYGKPVFHIISPDKEGRKRTERNKMIFEFKEKLGLKRDYNYSIELYNDK